MICVPRKVHVCPAVAIEAPVQGPVGVVPGDGELVPSARGANRDDLRVALKRNGPGPAKDAERNSAAAEGGGQSPIRVVASQATAHRNDLPVGLDCYGAGGIESLAEIGCDSSVPGKRRVRSTVHVVTGQRELATAGLAGGNDLPVGLDGGGGGSTDA